MAGTSVVSGLASGLDWRKIIEQLRKLEYRKIDLIAEKKKEYENRISAWQGINKQLLALKTKAETLNLQKGFNLFTSSLSSNTNVKAEDILSVTAGEEANIGTYQIVVHQLARAQKLSSTGFASQTTALNLSGDLLVSGKTVTISSTDTLLSIRNKINAVNTGANPSGVTASIVNYGPEGYRLILTGDQEGSEGFSLLNGGAEDILGALGIQEIQSGLDALLSIDGISVTSSSNKVKEVIQGVTLDLKRADLDTTITVRLGRDYDGLKEKIKGFVTAYNDVMDVINAQFSYNEEKQKTGGVLFGDSALRSMKSKLTQTILNKVSGTVDSFSTLGLIGISLDLQSKLKVDDQKLQGYLETNFEDVKRLFSVHWTSTGSHLSYIYHTIDTRAGTYSVQITGVNPVEGYFLEPGDAAGNGTYLRGISGNAKGLTVGYSGTSTGPIGTLTLNFGVAELLNRSLYHLTDPLRGTISNKTDGIEDAIRDMEDEILKMEMRIDQRMLELESRFIAMETALSAMQSQMGWLSGQIQTISRGWW